MVQIVIFLMFRRNYLPSALVKKVVVCSNIIYISNTIRKQVLWFYIFEV